jgi:phage recombination protein Bet
MTNEIAITTKTDLVIEADQNEFTSQQVAVLKQLGIEDASEGDLKLFFHQAKRTGLDPFAKQIYMIGRKTKVGGYRGEPERWETKWTIQTGIHGYRLNGRRAAARAGEKVKTEGPFWQGADGGGWTDVWLDANRPPAAAKFTIIRDDEAFTGIAMYSEFVQTNRDGTPNSMWKKMPANQTAKCAEAAAWQKAFPDDFSGLVLEDSAQVIDESGQTIRAAAERVQGPKRGTAGLAEKLGVQTAPAPEPAAEPPADPTPEVATPDELKALTEALKAADITDVAEIKAFLSGRIGRELGTMKDLTSLEVAAVLDFIENGEPA